MADSESVVAVNTNDNAQDIDQDDSEKNDSEKISPVADVDANSGLEQEDNEANSSEMTDQTGAEEMKDVPDEYKYTQRDEFTSEIYKLSISNLPKRFGFVVSFEI